MVIEGISRAYEFWTYHSTFVCHALVNAECLKRKFIKPGLQPIVEPRLPATPFQMATVYLLTDCPKFRLIDAGHLCRCTIEFPVS